jgi:hypothetical protein
MDCDVEGRAYIKWVQRGFFRATLADAKMFINRLKKLVLYTTP